jgi:two-component system OmpR family response regulator
MFELGRALILIVENNSDVRDLYGSALEAAGFRYIRVAAAETAFREAKALRLDIAIVDLGLKGGMDGIELARRFRAAGNPAALIAVTGRPAKGAGQETLFDTYLLKPCLPEDMVEAVRCSLLLAPGCRLPQ